MPNPLACVCERVESFLHFCRKKNSGENNEENDGENRESSNANSSSSTFVEVDLLRADINATRNFPNNKIRTAKYKWYTAFPCSLVSQFYKVSNVFFLLISVLTLIPGVSPVSPFSSITPLVFVLAAGVLKDIWEDKKRQASDKRANDVDANVLRGNEFVTVRSSEVQVGDIILYRLGEEVLADGVVLNSSYADGVMYIETANLDGETNAKTRRAKPETVEYLGTAEDIIHQCLPSAELREHYMKCGTTMHWRGTQAHASMPTPNASIRQSDAPQGTPAALSSNAMTTGGNTGPAKPSSSPFPLLPDHAHTSHTNAIIRPLRSTENRPEKNRLSRHSSMHLSSQTLDGEDVPELNSLSGDHSRRLALDERFALGDSIPIPSNIAQMSREYEQRHNAEHTSQHLFSEPMGESMNRIRGATGLETPSVNIPIEEFTGAGSGVVLLAAPPRAELYSWIGQLRMPDGDTVPLGIEQFVPRGCVVRNTEWVLCAVVYVGRETKMLLSLRPRARKVSVIGKRINILNLSLFVLHQIFCFLMCSFSLHWRNSHLVPPEGTLSGHSTWYLQWYLSKYSSGEFFGWYYIAYFILLSYFIPVSLYVSLEFNKAMQMLLLAYDRRMSNFDEFSGKLRFSRPKTSELNCQLAHVQYIFTDKTGTLTENLMTYVGGCTTSLTHDERENPGGLGEEMLGIIRREQRPPHTRGSFSTSTRGLGPAKAGEAKGEPCKKQYDFNEEEMESEPTFLYLRALALCHGVVCFDRAPNDVDDLPNAATNGASGTLQGPSLQSGSDVSLGSRAQAVTNSETHERRLSAVFGASASMMQGRTASGVQQRLHGRTGSASWYAARHNERCTGSRGTLVPFEVSDLRDNSKIYEGQSLDEIALVSAARDNLFALYRRNAKEMFVKVVDKIMCYEIIAELEFSPQRKLMSILLFRNPEHDHLANPGGSNAQAGQEDPAARSYMRSQKRSELLSSEMGPSSRTNTKGPSVTNTKRIINASSSQHGKSASQNEDQDVPPVGSPSSSVSPGDRFGSEERPYLLLVKGADNTMFAIANKQNPQNGLQLPTFQHELEVMAREGLRTLVLGQRYCTEREVREWLPQFNEALCSMHNRSEMLHQAYALLERDVDLIGTTAVEDRLQEGVPETLNFFLRTEIVVWLLTGDKRETAVTIAGTSGLIDEEFKECVYHLDVTEAATHFPSTAAAIASPEISLLLDDQLHAAVNFCDEADLRYGSTPSVVLVVDGQTLDFIFADQIRTQRFFDIGRRSRSAICCRMNPLQKSQIVRLFQKNTESIVLAIGDGANDVPMIQESHIGVGIMGLEGSQAELASDYAIPKFRFLKRLLVVHGRFSLLRDGNCIVFSLYKNILLTIGLNVYSIYSGFSAVLFIESWVLAVYNLFLLSLQPVAIGIFDKDVEDELAESLPEIYPALSREDMFFSWKYICKFLFDAFVDGLVLLFFVIYTVARSDDLYSWHGSALEDYGMLFFIMMLVVVNLRAAALTTCYTFITGSAVVVSFALIPILLLIYAFIQSLFGSTSSASIAKELVGSWKFWVSILFALGVFAVYGLGVNTYMMLFCSWKNGEPAMGSAWRSPYRLEHHERRRRLKQGKELLWEATTNNRRTPMSHLRY